MASSASPKCSSGSDTVLHSINKTHKKESISPSIADQIPEQIYTCRINQGCELLIDVGVAEQPMKVYHTIPVLLDSGANATFIDISDTEWMGFPLKALKIPIHVVNMDGTHNLAGDVTHTMTIAMEYLGHHKELQVEVTNLGKNSLILGYMWLQNHNPVIDWQAGSVKFTQCPHSCHMLQDWAKYLTTLNQDECKDLEFIHQAKVEAPVAKKPAHSPEELVPPCYYSYLNIFSEKAASRFPLQKPWDHTIDLKETFGPKKGQLIPLFPEEQKEVSEFIDEQLVKGYIHPSKSKQTSPVFFVLKKDGRK